MNSQNQTPQASGQSGQAILTRVVVPVSLVALAVWQFVQGVPALPTWIPNFFLRLGWSVDPETLLRVLIGLELAGACIMVLLGSAARMAAMLLLGAACFVILAEISHAGTSPGLVLRIVALIGAILLMGLVTAAGSDARPGTTRPSAYLAALTGIAAAWVAAFVVPIGALSSPEVTDTPTAINTNEVNELVRKTGLDSLKRELFLLEPDTWLGHNVKDLPWAPYVPDEVTEALQEGEQLVVFYRPDDELSIRVIENYIAVVAPTVAWAIRIPLAPSADPALNRPQSLNCENCRMLRLPSGLLYFSNQLPLVLRVSDGVVKHFSQGNSEIDIEICIEGLP